MYAFNVTFSRGARIDKPADFGYYDIDTITFPIHCFFPLGRQLLVERINLSAQKEQANSNDYHP
jgi:hypothetical protein